jgi:hypothetical protein
MSEQIFKQSFSNKFSGIDGQTSSIEPDGDTVNRAVNYEMAVGNSLRGRVGCQTSGSYGFFAIFPYRYTRTQDQYDILYQTAAGAYPTQTPGLATTKTTADGASIEKLIALNRQVWVLDAMNITVTQSVAAAYTWYTSVSGSSINFNILKDGVSILNETLGDGIISATSIYALLGIIDASSDLAVSRTTRGTCPPFALINGNQSSAAVSTTSYGTTYSWTVSNTPHNFSAGDIISWINSSTGVLQAGFVLSTTATTITYVGPQGTATNGQVLGYQAQAATSFPISTVSSETAGALTISFPYWRYIPEGDKDFGHIYDSAYAQWQAKSSGSFYAPAVAVNDSGNLYIAASGQVSAGSSTWANNLIKLDGTTVGRAGLPSLEGLTPINAGAGALTGTYKYKAFLRRCDAQGNILDGPVRSSRPITLAANIVALAALIPQYSSATGFLVRSCYKHTTESPASGESFYVDDSNGGVGNAAFMQPGDPICLTDNTAQLAGVTTPAGAVVGTLHRTVCTAYSAQAATISPTTSSIKVADSSGYQINTNTEISAGFTIVILRTTAGGNQFYKLVEVPITGFGGSAFSINDNATDTALTANEQYVEVELGKEHDAPPPCTLVCQHQGGLVVARGPTAPNTVSFSTAEGLEYFPTASNSFDVPSTQSGFITAIASDTDDRLAVFKSKAYYDVVGDLDAGAFSVNVRAEGDYGITSQASLVRVAGGLIGLSKNGFVTIQDGILDPYKFQEPNARVINQPYQFAWATAVNDSFCRNYVCSIPQISGEPVSYLIDYSRGDIKVMERSYATKIDQAGGMAMIGDTLYHLSQTSPYGVFRRLIRFDSANPSPTGNNGDSFIDNTGAITYVLEPVPINGGDPALLKTWRKGRIWSIPNDYVQEGWVPFSVLVESVSSPIASYLSSTSPTYQASTVSFATANDIFKQTDFKNRKGQFLLIRLTTSTIRTSPFITGYETMYALSYVKKDLIK